MSEMPYHIPALLKETVDGLNVNPDGVYVDVTFGGGGHSREIMRRLGKKGKLISFDQDLDACANRIDDERFVFVRSNFRYLKNFLRYHGIEKVDGILADLGVSFHHFDVASRGFSFRMDGELDMRLNVKASQKASDVLNEYSEEDLTRIFRVYGELAQPQKMAKAVVRAREEKPFVMVQDLLSVAEKLIAKERAKKEWACVFQALRIEVNKEMEALKQLLMQSAEVLKVGGRLSVLSYHSLEDRLVKNFMKTGNFDGKVEKDFYGNVIAPLKMTSNKVIVPSAEEVERNPRSRSAKLRIAEKA
ncbi:MAG: 16S rRNA (cytosine(1402)-N(4))-methyltransferase RsmH [Paludibacteraceae bacterium]|nr:16S rRNA (cytosine(1402)-N(4))-methyltransferase RsmH [Paludibacteraceae bacterium]